MTVSSVIIKDCEGKARIRFAVEARKNIIYIVDEQGLRELRGNGKTDRMIGFPERDVYSQSEAFKVKEGEMPDWTRLKKWQFAAKI